jgi:site-specific DNA-methyltransferase (adenine-specific)/adenine-specific DNA-methyltransferase
MNNDRQRKIYELLKRGLKLAEANEELPTEWARELFPPERREYELVYNGKESEEQILADTMAVPLQPVSTFGKNGTNWHNKLIFGDNLQAMKTLFRMKERGELLNADGTSGIRLVYIDPPFATKKEFRGSEDQKAYQDKIESAQFLEFLRKRLVLIRDLLSDDGTVYVHLDYRKLHYIKALGDEIFGENNFMNEIIWCYRERGISKTFWNNKHQTILVWTKRKGNQVFNFEAARIPYSEEYLKKFKYDDENGKYQIRGKNITGSPVQRADGLTPATEKLYPDLTYRQYLKDGQLPLDWWEISLLNKAANERTGYPTQKPESLLARIIKASSNEGDLVMDCFAGSGTTLAVAEKLNRKWIGIDCGKLSIYKTQKRLLNIENSYDLSNQTSEPDLGSAAKDLLMEISDTKDSNDKLSVLIDSLETTYNRNFEKQSLSSYGKRCVAFTLYNAGLYDFESLRRLPWEGWRSIALQLFECKDEPHKIRGFLMDGKRQGSSVLVFNHFNKGTVSRETVTDLHASIGKQIGERCFIIAPRGAFLFQEDYIELDGVRYYALRIPYSYINELHRREFSALTQPSDEMAVNETVEAVGFDFIQPPLVEIDIKIRTRTVLFKIKKFESRARVKGQERIGKHDALSMVMVDFDYHADVFDLDKVFYAAALKENGWKIEFSHKDVVGDVMLVFLDIYGNESRMVIEKNKLEQGTTPSNKRGSLKK